MSELGKELNEANNNEKILEIIFSYLEKQKLQLSCERRKLEEYLDKLDDLLFINKKFDPNEYMVVLALIHKDVTKPISSCLPFFSRLNLRDTARSLRDLNYNVGFTFIKRVR